MRTGIVIKDPNSNNYYTGRYDGYWSKYIEDARIYDNIEAFIKDSGVNDEEKWEYEKAFENKDISMCEIITVIKFEQ